MQGSHVLTIIPLLMAATLKTLVVILSVIGLVTRVCFFVSRDVYGTIAFHNFSGILGVIRALDASGNYSTSNARRSRCW